MLEIPFEFYFPLRRRAIREALMNSNASGQDIVDELDALTAQTSSPTSTDGVFRERNLMSPHSTDWSRALGWAGGSPFQSHAVPFEERPNSPERRAWPVSNRAGTASI